MSGQTLQCRKTGTDVMAGRSLPARLGMHTDGRIKKLWDLLWGGNDNLHTPILGASGGIVLAVRTFIRRDRRGLALA